METPAKRLLAIINPISGNRSKKNVPEMIRRYLDADRFRIETVFTRYAGHATELATAAAREGIDYVLSVGGDGTCNETAQALVHTETALGLVPVGSGNGLARHLGIPLDIRRALQLVNAERVVSIDYCKANGRPFFVTCGVGFDALISLKFAQDKRRGGLTYVRKAIEEFVRYKSECYQLESSDGSIREKAFLIACANASQYGNNAYIAPHANMQDGKMDITLIKPFTALDVAPLALQLFTKTIDRNSKIISFEKEAVSIIREEPGIMHLDGEPVETDARIEISCYRQALRVLVPEPVKNRSIIEPVQTALLDRIREIRSELDI